MPSKKKTTSDPPKDSRVHEFSASQWGEMTPEQRLIAVGTATGMPVKTWVPVTNIYPSDWLDPKNVI